ncbi:hypothetical protein [Chryseobacterium sp. Marseille-Q8038]
MNDNKLKHLEFIQNTINRMSTNSFVIKGWCITIFAAVYTLSNKESDKSYNIINYLIIPLFWYLNAYFLQLERKYRILYNKVRILDEIHIDFSMEISKNDFKNLETNIFSCCFSKSLWYSLYNFTFSEYYTNL